MDSFTSTVPDSTWGDNHVTTTSTRTWVLPNYNNHLYLRLGVSSASNTYNGFTYGNYNIEDTADFTVYIPKTDPLFAGSLSVIPLQLLGYYVSVAKGYDVDKPRNLAKSVTVE